MPDYFLAQLYHNHAQKIGHCSRSYVKQSHKRTIKKYAVKIHNAVGRVYRVDCAPRKIRSQKSEKVACDCQKKRQRNQQLVPRKIFPHAQQNGAFSFSRSRNFIHLSSLLGNAEFLRKADNFRAALRRCQAPPLCRCQGREFCRRVLPSLFVGQSLLLFCRKNFL